MIQRRLYETYSYFVDKGSSIFKRYLADPERNPVPAHVKRLARLYSTFLPEAGSYSVKASLHMMRTSVGNLVCTYHSGHDRRFDYHDTTRKVRKGAKYQLYGVPHRGELIGRGKPKDSVTPHANHMHCGCRIDHALMGYLWFKDCSYYSRTAKKREGWVNQQLDPRARAMLYDCFVTTSGYADVTEMFAVDEQGNRRSQLDIVDIQINNLRRNRAKMIQNAKANEERSKKEEEVDLLAMLKMENGGKDQQAQYEFDEEMQDDGTEGLDDVEDDEEDDEEEDEDDEEEDDEEKEHKGIHMPGDPGIGEDDGVDWESLYPEWNGTEAGLSPR